VLICSQCRYDLSGLSLRGQRVTCPECGGACFIRERVPNARRWLNHAVWVSWPALIVLIAHALSFGLTFVPSNDIVQPVLLRMWFRLLAVGGLVACVWWVAHAPVLAIHVYKQRKYRRWPTLLALALSPFVLFGMWAGGTLLVLSIR
jgi:DNA-directed RNA polymerase subunit RPC12/RpoP